MEETLQHQTTPQCSGLPPTSLRGHRSDGTQAHHALTFKLDRLGGADHLNQDVFVIDPFGVSKIDDAYKASFNPLADLNPHSDDFIDECDSIADALVVQEGSGQNAYFYDAARIVLRGYIAWVAAHPDIAETSLVEVKRLLFFASHFSGNLLAKR